MYPVFMQAVTILFVAILALAVAWETWHLINWGMTMWEAHGDGSLSAYLRNHAYTYVHHVFGDLGWEAVEVIT